MDFLHTLLEPIKLLIDKKVSRSELGTRLQNFYTKDKLYTKNEVYNKNQVYRRNELHDEWRICPSVSYSWDGDTSERDSFQLQNTTYYKISDDVYDEHGINSGNVLIKGGDSHLHSGVRNICDVARAVSPHSSLLDHYAVINFRDSGHFSVYLHNSNNRTGIDVPAPGMYVAQDVTAFTLYLSTSGISASGVFNLGAILGGYDNGDVLFLSIDDDNNLVIDKNTIPTVIASRDYVNAKLATLPPSAVGRINELIDAKSIPTPTTATVGQTLVVKAVDENGKPTEWECVDAADSVYLTDSNGVKYQLVVDTDGTLSTEKAT